MNAIDLKKCSLNVFDLMCFTFSSPAVIFASDLAKLLTYAINVAVLSQHKSKACSQRSQAR